MDYDYTPPPPRRSFKLPLLLIASLVALVAVPWFTHNQLTEKQEAIAAAWADVESNLQRRADLIPNLIRSVQAYMSYESETLGGLAKQRSTVLNTKSGQPPASSAQAQEIARLDAEIAEGTRIILTRAANYPQLQASDQFLQLQAQLEGTENRINIARMRYNEAVREYNSAIQGFIGQHVAESLDMHQRPYFEAASGKQSPVTVDFNP